MHQTNAGFPIDLERFRTHCITGSFYLYKRGYRNRLWLWRIHGFFCRRDREWRRAEVVARYIPKVQHSQCGSAKVFTTLGQWSNVGWDGGSKHRREKCLIMCYAMKNTRCQTFRKTKNLNFTSFLLGKSSVLFLMI